MMTYDHVGNFLILHIYINNILFTGNNSQLIQHLIEKLHLVFSLKDLGDLSYVLGIEITPTDNGLYLNQGFNTCMIYWLRYN